MLAAAMTLLNMIPGISSLVQFIAGKWMDSKVAMYQARTGAVKEVAIAAIQAEASSNNAKVGWLNAVATSPFLMFIVGGFAFPFIFYLNKVIVWDICLGLGFTPKLEYVLLSNWGEIILTGIFVTSTGVGITQAVINRTK
jgi:hypothetical protein